jgi:hypothetical protein
VVHLSARQESAGVLPTACDRGRANGCAKNRHGTANGANDGGWANLSDVVTGKENENENVASASASAVDAKDEEVKIRVKGPGPGNAPRCVARGLQAPSDRHPHPHPHRACFEL